MYSVAQSEQLSVFLYSLGLGFVIGICYDIFRGIRLSLPQSKVAVVIFDILFFTLSGIVTFIFILAFNKGEIRFYIIAGEVTGCLFYYFSFGIIAIKLTNAFSVFLRKFYSLIYKIISLPLRVILKLFKSLKNKLSQKLKKSRKNSEKIRKKHLPKLRLYVYNLFGILLINSKAKRGDGNGNGKSKKEKEINKT